VGGLFHWDPGISNSDRTLGGLKSKNGPSMGASRGRHLTGCQRGLSHPAEPDQATGSRIVPGRLSQSAVPNEFRFFVHFGTERRSTAY